MALLCTYPREPQPGKCPSCDLDAVLPEDQEGFICPHCCAVFATCEECEQLMVDVSDVVNSFDQDRPAQKAPWDWTIEEHLNHQDPYVCSTENGVHKEYFKHLQSNLFDADNLPLPLDLSKLVYGYARLGFFWKDPPIVETVDMFWWCLKCRQMTVRQVD